VGGPAVSYNLTIDLQPTYLRARGVGERTPQNMLRFFKEVHEACASQGIWSVLLEVNFTGPSMGTTNVFDVVSKGSRDGMKLERIAYVEAGIGDVEAARFAETVAINRGVNVRLFRDSEAAKAWLENP
jgi:hypothetical protein